MEKISKYLFLIVVGGEVPNANVEIHDVRWAVGSKIEDTFENLRNNWLGSKEGLHIDSYKKIEFVDGYKISLKNCQTLKSKTNYLIKKRQTSKKLWFVNLGGYDPNSMQEKHEFGLVVASSSSEAKAKAKSKWLIGFRKKHKDDCINIKNIDNWEIELSKENKLPEDKFSPDWFGYMRIDKFV